MATPPTEENTDSPGPYHEAIDQLLAAAERTHDPEARITLTTLAEMFVRLNQHQQQLSRGSEGPT